MSHELATLRENIILPRLASGAYGGILPGMPLNKYKRLISYFMRVVKRQILTFAVLALILAGCTGLSTLPNNDAAYIKQKIETALGRNNCIKEMVVLDQGGRVAVITLISSMENEEDDCLKAMQSLSHDSMIPLVDELCICVHQKKSISLKRQLGTAVVQGVIAGLAGATSVGSSPSEEEVTTFSCKITREALLRGEKPEIVIRQSFFVSGPYAGQRTDSLWLTENKSQPAVTSTNSAVR